MILYFKQKDVLRVVETDDSPELPTIEHHINFVKSELDLGDKAAVLALITKESTK